MLRRKRDGRVFTVMLLSALLLLLSTAAPQLAQEEEQQQKQQEQQPPLRRMRRVRGDQPKAPALPSNDQAPAGEDDDVVRVDTDLATVLLTAIDKDRRFVTTLKREDVRVVEDNVPQELSVFERETELPLTLAILIDTSRSQERTLPDEKLAARAFIDSVLRPDRDRAAIISFTGEAVLQQDLTNDLGKLRGAVEQVVIEFPMGSPECEGNVTPERELRCYTGVWDAAWVTVNDVLSQTPAQSRRAIILLTDGKDSSSMTKRQEAIDFAVKHNVVIYSVGIGDGEYEGVADDALKKISEKTGGRAFFPENRQELDAAFAQIQQELRSQYLLAYKPANTKRDGSFRQVRVEIINPELRKQKLQLLYRRGYYARSAPRPK
ncbi:MAG TPA: VWA domain-containing protein [Pyrinomonadaceae bacterium]|nr:VWA domain-containing protein [Pyrinomonadaceae bacterium]